MTGVGSGGRMVVSSKCVHLMIRTVLIELGRESLASKD